MAERLRNSPDNLLERIPIGILERLRPFRGRLDEVFQHQADFPHLRYHTLDCLMALRECDRASAKARGEIINAYFNYDYPHEEHIKRLPGVDKLDLPTYFKIERALQLHDVGRSLVEMGVLKPEEHHFGSYFVAALVDGDKKVCDAVLGHVADTLPKRATLVSRYVRDIDRMVGAGYVGLIRQAIYMGFDHPLFHERDEDRVINNGVMTAFTRWGGIYEVKAEYFFWKEVYPLFKDQGKAGLISVATTSKILLDRIVGRDYRKRTRASLTAYEGMVLDFEPGVRVVDSVMPEVLNYLRVKLENTLKALIITRRDLMKMVNPAYHPSVRDLDYQLTPEEDEGYKSFLLGLNWMEKLNDLGLL